MSNPAQAGETRLGRSCPVRAESLLRAAAVRSHAEQLMALAMRSELAHFTWHPERMDAAAAYVADTIRQRHPDLRVPVHSRWRHFETGGVDRFASLLGPLHATPQERARIAIDLVVPSVLLDAGAGAQWRYADTVHGQVLARSEGLGVASFALFASGALSDDPSHPLRTDAAALRRVTAQRLAGAFQVTPANPLVGIDGRLALLSNLGDAMRAAPQVFADPERPGSLRLGRLFDHLQAQSGSEGIGAAEVLANLLHLFSPVWPGRLTLDGVNLGDCWRHPATDDGYAPFHKLTQWLTYSLLEPLEQGGLRVNGLDALTGLPEYRNGGFLLDIGLLQPREAALAQRPLAVDSEAVVEWRALTVAALDRLADAVRAQLGVRAEDFPLARVIEGGTWFAGRRIAAERRADGGPPLRIVSDGTVF